MSFLAWLGIAVLILIGSSALGVLLAAAGKRLKPMPKQPDPQEGEEQ
ncbi:hypothetical protein [Streptacidiphilus carbonis]|nr:hypothetical protein [Streptacidiphilus carbonis]